MKVIVYGFLKLLLQLQLINGKVMELLPAERQKRKKMKIRKMIQNLVILLMEVQIQLERVH